MPDIDARGPAVFRTGDKKIIGDFGAILRTRAASNGHPSAALRLPCAFVFADQGCADE